MTTESIPTCCPDGKTHICITCEQPIVGEFVAWPAIRDKRRTNLFVNYHPACVPASISNLYSEVRASLTLAAA